MLGSSVEVWESFSIAVLYASRELLTALPEFVMACDPEANHSFCQRDQSRNPASGLVLLSSTTPA